MAACAGASGAGRPLVMMAVLGVLWGGACFGFNGIKRVLLIEGLFLDACDGGEARCGAQLDRLDFAWTFSSSMLNVFAIVNGCAIDALGLRRVCFLSGGLLGLGAVCFGLVVTRARLEYLLAYAHFALVESGMLLSFGGLSLQGAEGSVALCGRVFDVKVVAAPVMETAFALGTLVFPLLGLAYDAAPSLGVAGLHCVYFGCCAALIAACGCAVAPRPLRRPARDVAAALDRRALCFVLAASLAVGANITQQGYYVATFSEQAAWHGRPETLGALLDWGFPALALPSLVVVARLEERWHDGGFERTCGHGYAALALAQVIWGVLSAARDWRLQIGAVALFVPARLLGFVHLYESVGFFFPPEHFGVVAGTCASVGGLAAAVASECLKRWLHASGGDPRRPNLALAARGAEPGAGAAAPRARAPRRRGVAADAGLQPGALRRRRARLQDAGLELADAVARSPAAAAPTPVAALDFGESAPARDSAVASYADEWALRVMTRGRLVLALRVLGLEAVGRTVSPSLSTSRTTAPGSSSTPSALVIFVGTPSCFQPW
ncbi:hypothetical protein JL722_1472 [Aureococcus anophagefferens]|nr:hypothetical protein JL722_1472 [Aureococcus anophagefferens]